MLDEMERMPHKKPDDDMARIVKEFTPRTLEFVKAAEEFGEDVFISKQLRKQFGDYRHDYEEALSQHFDTFIAPAELKPNATEEERFNAHEIFVRDTTFLNENEVIKQYAATKTADPKAQEVLAQQLETHFGTLRNHYMRGKDAAQDVSDDWMSSLGDKNKPRQL